VEIPAEPQPTRPIPRARLGEVGNVSPFTHFHCTKMGPGRRFYDVVVIKGAFTLAPGIVELATPSASIVYADEPFDIDKDERSSLRRAGDVILGKPGTDVIVSGSAKAPGGRPSVGWIASVEVAGKDAATRLRSDLQVTGPRSFEHRRLLGWAIGEPDAATEVPVRYELAFGGAYLDPDPDAEEPWRIYEPNPSGLGFVDAVRLDREATYPAPQWQDPAHPVTKFNGAVPLAGFGAVPRPWASRLRYAGTYDDAWLAKARADAARELPVDYPKDFNHRFFQCAHPALTTATHLRGDERIRLVGLARQPVLDLKLPGVALRAELFRALRPRIEIAPSLDTIVFDLDRERVELTWRVAIGHELEIQKVLLFVDEEAA
jgi:hypothetical protein